MSAQANPAAGTLVRFAVRMKEGLLDAEAEGIQADAVDLGVNGVEQVRISRVYYVRGELSDADIKRMASELLTDPVVEECEWNPLTPTLSPGGEGRVRGTSVEVAYRPGVRDPVEDSVRKGAADLGIEGIKAVHTAKEYSIRGPVNADGIARLTEKLLVNGTIQQIVTQENLAKLFTVPQAAPVAMETVPLLQAGDTVLQRISLDYQFSLNLEEMQAVQAYFRLEKREPALIELETIAQTWSEHCKHKTMRGTIVYTEEIDGKAVKKTFQNLLKETIVRATEELDKPWCVSVFSDNSGVIGFDDKYHLCFKVETHNHPSALEPFGGASTGIGGVIRDILGTGLGAKPVASTDVFCFPPPDFPLEKVPQGVLSPRRLIKGVVAGVKDYGNKMGIPTVNGAVLFDERFVGNPLVYCGNVGLLPVGKVEKKVEPGMAVVVAGGRTGRDGIHGATFSSLTLTTESEVVSSTAVQIGDPITEKKLTDAMLEARDKGLYASVTDCGAGGLSSAVGEMAADCDGVRVDLEKAPLKYSGLTAEEIWISESQERVVLAVAPAKLDSLLELFRLRGVEAVSIGEFTSTGRLELMFKGVKVGELGMKFLHDGLPRSPRPARWTAPSSAEPELTKPQDLAGALLKLLGRWDTCSKEWIIRQYDHEVQGGSVIKPAGIGPSDAAVFRPRLDSERAAVLANGINFRYGDIDPYWMAALAVDEVVRQVACVGGDLDRLAILDNFCWGDPTRLEVLGSLVRASVGCYDAAKAYGTPFISGKDSLNNEYKMGEKRIQIPGTLLISGIAVMEDARKAVTMDAKKPGNFLYITGLTKKEMGGSAYYASLDFSGGQVPQVDLQKGPQLLKAVAQAAAEGITASAHDCSEGGLGVAAAEMAFAGTLGLTIDLRKVPLTQPSPQRGEGKGEGELREDFILFSESPSRILLEVPPEKAAALEKKLAGFPLQKIGQFEQGNLFRVTGLDGKPALETTTEQLREAWEAPFKGW